MERNSYKWILSIAKEIVLVVTGWDMKLRESARKYEGVANYFACPEFLPKGQAVTEHLEKPGYAPRDIDYCILTHLDIERQRKRTVWQSLQPMTGRPH